MSRFLVKIINYGNHEESISTVNHYEFLKTKIINKFIKYKNYKNAIKYNIIYTINTNIVFLIHKSKQNNSF